MDKDIKKSLRKIVGPENFSDALIDLVSFSSDASDHKSRPDAAVWPLSTEQVRAVITLANQQSFPVLPRGAGTGLAGAAVPLMGGVVMDLSRMARILEINIEDRVAVMEPGVVYAELEKALAPHGFFFPPDPGSGKACTLGGNVATNAGGIKGAKYGTTKDYVLGLQVVLGDGRVMRTGTRTMKAASGFDLTHLFVGSEGCLGVVTEITLKINPRPLATATASAAFEDLPDAGRAVSGIMSSGIVPSVLEILGRETIEAINQNTELDLPLVDALLLAETDGYTQEEADFQMDKVLQVFRANHAGQITKAQDARQTAKLWQARKSCYAVLARLKPYFVLEDVTVPISQVAALLAGVASIAQESQLQIATFGHSGDGNLHPQILWEHNNPDTIARVEKAADALFKLALDLGGTLTGEHGIGLSKAKYMSLEHDPVAIGSMRGLKDLFDRNGILNPGKMDL